MRASARRAPASWRRTSTTALFGQKLVNITKTSVLPSNMPMMRSLAALMLVLGPKPPIVFTNTGSGGNMSFLIAMALTVVLYLITYFLLFIGYIVLVLKHKDKKRSYQVPGGDGFKILLASVGFLVSVFAFVISFVPPSSLPGASDESYVTLLVVSFLFVFAIPFVIYALHNKHGKSLDHDLVPIRTHNAPEGHFFIHPRARATHHLVPATTRRPKP